VERTLFSTEVAAAWSLPGRDPSRRGWCATGHDLEVVERHHLPHFPPLKQAKKSKRARKTPDDVQVVPPTKPTAPVMTSTTTLIINRAPVLVLWAAMVAYRKTGTWPVQWHDFAQPRPS